MRKIVLRASSLCVGTDAAELLEVSDDTTDKELDAIANQFGLDNAEMYGHYPECERPEDMDEDDEYYDSYGDNIDGWWETYDEIKHDGLF